MSDSSNASGSAPDGPPPLPRHARPKAIPPPLPPDRGSRTERSSDGEGWDGALRALGLAPDPKGLAGLNYIGERNGRAVKVHCSRRTRTRYSGEIRRTVYAGHRLEFRLATPVKTRLAISKPRSALERWGARTNRWFGASEIREGEMARHFTIWASEPDWAIRFLDDPGAREAARRLLPVENLPPNIGLKWSPGHLVFTQRLAVGGVDGTRLSEWLLATERLAELAEANPPSLEVEPTKWETWTEEQPVLAGCVLLGGLVAVFLLVAVVFVGILLAVSFALSR